MTEKELKKIATGKTGLPAVLLALKIIFDLAPQVILVYIIGRLSAGEERGWLMSAFAALFVSFALKGFGHFATSADKGAVRDKTML